MEQVALWGMAIGVAGICAGLLLGAIRDLVVTHRRLRGGAQR